MPNDFERGIEALLNHAIIDCLFDAQLQGPIPYTEEGYAVLIKATMKVMDDLGEEEMADLRRRWLEFARANEIDPGY
jgi:hypothetical protein